jgi:hypothetical protein|nr:MAG TPA: hypothetical protein [Caudoviricetes sp.]
MTTMNKIVSGIVRGFKNIITSFALFILRKKWHEKLPENTKKKVSKWAVNWVWKNKLILNQWVKPKKGGHWWDNIPADNSLDPGMKSYYSECYGVLHYLMGSEERFDFNGMVILHNATGVLQDKLDMMSMHKFFCVKTPELKDPVICVIRDRDNSFDELVNLMVLDESKVIHWINSHCDIFSMYRQEQTNAPAVYTFGDNNTVTEGLGLYIPEKMFK